MKFILILLLMTLPSLAFASDMSGLLYLLGIQLIVVVWPIILPLFFILKGPDKLKSYLIKLVIIYGLIGVAMIPTSFYNQFGMWFGVYDSIDYDYDAAARIKNIIYFSINVIAFIISLFIFKKYKINLSSKKQGRLD